MTPLLVSTEAAAGEAQQNARRLRRSTVSLGVVLLVLVALGVMSFLQTEIRLETVATTQTSLSSETASLAPTASLEPTASLVPTASVEATVTVVKSVSRVDDVSVMDNGDLLASDYECVGWFRTGACSPNGPREPENDADCKTKIQGGLSGYCVFRHRQTNATRRVLPMHCDSLIDKVSVRCDQAAELYQYGERAMLYEHDAAISQDENQAAVLASLPTSVSKPLSLKRGISIVVHESVLASAFASVRNLRELGCSLAVEMWFKANETKPDHPILRELVAKYGVFLRELTDPRATTYYTKLFAVFYSAFDSVLLLDADNFAVKDPEYLYETDEFKSTGAMFWPDFWHPSSTIFNIHAQSLVWPVFGLNYVDMFEQESGQVLINRRRHLKAVNAMMYYATAQPRVFEDLKLAWGDKDLFRFAWMKTQSSFHFVSRPPGSAGKLHEQKKKFCGLTMVQHDPQGEIVFLHRNLAKLRLNEGRSILWTHIEDFKPDSPTTEYAIVWARVFDKVESCWGPHPDSTHYERRPISDYPFRELEPRLLKYIDEAATLTR